MEIPEQKLHTSLAFLVTLFLWSSRFEQKLGSSLHPLASRSVFPELLVCFAVDGLGGIPSSTVTSQKGRPQPFALRRVSSEKTLGKWQGWVKAPIREGVFDVHLTIPSIDVQASKKTPAWKAIGTGVLGILLATLLTFVVVDAYSAIKRRILRGRAKKRVKEEAEYLALYDKDLYSDSFSGDSGEDTNETTDLSVKGAEDPAKALQEMLQKEAKVLSER